MKTPKEKLSEKYSGRIILIPCLNANSINLARRQVVGSWSDWRKYKIETIFSHGNQRMIENGKVVFGYYESFPQLKLIRKTL